MRTLVGGTLAVGRAAVRRSRSARAPVPLRHPAGGAFAFALALALIGCAPDAPRPIAYGRDTCANCLMTVSDDRFGAELVTPTGKVHVFDSAECLAEYVRAHPEEAKGSLWVTEFDRPGALVPAPAASYVRTSTISSPMGLGVAALAPGREAPAELMGPRLTWSQVVALADGREVSLDPER